MTSTRRNFKVCILKSIGKSNLKTGTVSRQKMLIIMKTCPCNIQRNFLVVKMKIFTGKFLIFFLFLLIYVLSKNKKNINIFLMKFSIFTAEKNLCILHGQVFVM